MSEEWLYEGRLWGSGGGWVQGGPRSLGWAPTERVVGASASGAGRVAEDVRTVVVTSNLCHQCGGPKFRIETVNHRYTGTVY